MSTNPPNNPYMPVQPMPAPPVTVLPYPPAPDPQKQEQKALRRSASLVSFAALAAQPLSFLIMAAAGVFIGLCGVNVHLPAGQSVAGMPPALYYLLSSMLSFLTIALPFCLILLIDKRSLADAILVEKTDFLHGLSLVLVGLLLCLLMNYPANLISELLEELGLNGEINTESMVVTSTLDVVLMFISVVLVAPITEEFAFRGILMSSLRRWGIWPAVLLSALLFSFAHFSFQAMPVVFIGGLAMALLYVWTRNIWLNIFVHLLNNFIATLPIAVEFYAGTEATEAVSNLSMFIVIGLGAVAFIVLLALHFTGRHALFPKIARGVPVRKKGLWLFLNVGFILYFLTFIGLSLVALYAL